MKRLVCQLGMFLPILFSVCASAEEGLMEKGGKNLVWSLSSIGPPVRNGMFAEQVSVRQEAAGIVFELSLPRSAKTGGKILLRLRITNTNEFPIMREFSGDINGFGIIIVKSSNLLSPEFTEFGQKEGGGIGRPLPGGTSASVQEIGAKETVEVEIDLAKYLKFESGRYFISAGLLFTAQGKLSRQGELRIHFAPLEIVEG